MINLMREYLGVPQESAASENPSVSPSASKSTSISPSARLLSSKAVAVHLGYHNTHVNRLIRTGKMKGLKIGNKWFVTKRNLILFSKLHNKGSRYDAEEAIRENERSKEMDTQESKTNGKIWNQTEFLDQEKTGEYLKAIGGSRTGVFGETTMELACELESMPPGTSKRFETTSKEEAVLVQGYIREACYLAGWYKGIPDDERNLWVWWESHTHPGNRFGIKPHIVIVHLKEKRPSRAVTMRRNRIKKLQEAGGAQP